MPSKLPVPIGNTNYKEICKENYYVDKTLLVKDLLDEKAKTILFTSQALWQNAEHGYAAHFF